VQYLASILEDQGFEVLILDNWINSTITYDDVYTAIMERKDEICFVGTSSYMLSNASTKELVTKLKKNDINIISGGYGPTFEPVTFLEAGAELVCMGEGEKTIIDIANYFLGKIVNKKEIKGVSYLEKGKPKHTTTQCQILNLDDIPFPTRPFIELLKKRKSTINVLTSRGCNGKCSFCSISAFWAKNTGEKWRGRSIRNIIEELKILQAEGVETVKFIDDSFIENERDDQWCKDFADTLEREGLKFQFRASIRADKVTAEIMEQLKKAGFFSFSCGIENGSQSALVRMGKLASLKDNSNALECFRQFDYYVQAGFILFDDKTTLNELKENYVFMDKHIDLVTKGIFSEMFAAEGTNFTNNLRNKVKKKFSSNTLYELENESVRKVHTYLRKWQSNHIRIYDKLIDPISTPKAIELNRMKKYHELMMKMKKIDLSFMQCIIEQVECSGDLDALLHSYLREYAPFFEECMVKVNHYYQEDELQYDADINKFVLLHDKENEENVQ
jgi:tRNA A37 methylthiotransferase MiaB